jgi:hypothetical protein
MQQSRGLAHIAPVSPHVGVAQWAMGPVPWHVRPGQHSDVSLQNVPGCEQPVSSHLPAVHRPSQHSHVSEHGDPDSTQPPPTPPELVTLLELLIPGRGVRPHAPTIQIAMAKKPTSARNAKGSDFTRRRYQQSERIAEWRRDAGFIVSLPVQVHWKRYAVRRHSPHQKTYPTPSWRAVLSFRFRSSASEPKNSSSQRLGVLALRASSRRMPGFPVETSST